MATGNDETSTSTGDFGNSPEISLGNLESKRRVIETGKQAFDVCERLVDDWAEGIKHAAQITAKLNGERPYSSRVLKNQGKAWKTNISTGFLGTECGKIPPRFYMPVMSAKYLTAAQLPISWPNGVEKTQFFREEVTRAIRSWRKWNFFLRGLAREVGIFGIAYPCYFDAYEWRPSLIRMDKGFVPTGTEVMDSDIPFFCVKWDYHPWELLELLRKSKEAGLQNWNEEATVKAINKAMPISASTDNSNERTYEELIRESVESYSYAKSAKRIEAYHLFAKEHDGAVSHYVVLRANKDEEDGLLFSKEDAYESMDAAVCPMIFDYGDGTIHGSWGAGQILYDMAIQVEKVRNDSIDNLRNQNKLKIQVQDAKDVGQVKLTVNDTMMIVSGGQFNGAAAALPQNIDGYMRLDQELTRLAQEKIGAYVPPIPLAPSDIKAAQVNAAMQKEQEIQQALLDNWLMQVARLIEMMVKRLTNPMTPDSTANRLQKKLREKLTEEEINLLVDQPSIQTITDFTPFAAQQRAMFAASKMNNPLYNQRNLELVQAESAGGMHFAENVLLPEGDQTMVLEAQSQQTLETVALMQGMAMPVLPRDNDWIHAQTLEEPLKQALQQGNTQFARIGLAHYAAHYSQGVAKKQWPRDQINETKRKIAAGEKMLNEQEQAIAAQQQQAAMQQGGGGMPMQQPVV
jgi:hypothetical protein